MDSEKTKKRIEPNMTTENFKDQCSDITKEFNIQIPCRLAERVEAYPKNLIRLRQKPDPAEAFWQMSGIS